jgi:hypothetical protein
VREVVVEFANIIDEMTMVPFFLDFASSLVLIYH